MKHVREGGSDLTTDHTLTAVTVVTTGRPHSQPPSSFPLLPVRTIKRACSLTSGHGQGHKSAFKAGSGLGFSFRIRALTEINGDMVC